MESQVNISLFALYLAYTAFYMVINIKPLLRYKTQSRAFKTHLRFVPFSTGDKIIVLN